MSYRLPLLLVLLFATSALAQDADPTPAPKHASDAGTGLLDDPAALWDSKIAERAAWEATKDNRQVWAKEKRLQPKLRAQGKAIAGQAAPDPAQANGQSQANAKPQAARVQHKSYNKPYYPPPWAAYQAQWARQAYLWATTPSMYIPRRR